MGRQQFTTPTDINAQTLSVVDTSLTAKTANQLDEDFVAEDLSTGDQTVNEQSISGAQEIAVSIRENSGNNASATIKWTDGNGNVLFTETPSALTDVSNGSDYANLIVKSTHVIVVFSGSSTDMDGTVNAHG